MVQPRPASERGAGELPRPREPARSVAHELPDLLEAGARVLVAEGDQPLDVLLLERQVAQQVRAAPPACRRARSIRGRDDSSLAEPARFRRFSFSFGFSPTRTSSTASGRCLAFIPAYRHDGRAATRPLRILYVVKRGLEKFPCPGRVPRPSHVETPPITRHIRRCLLKPQRIRRVAMSYRAQMFSRFLPLSVHAARSNLRGALSAKVSSLPPEAFGLVPPLPPYSEFAAGFCE